MPCVSRIWTTVSPASAVGAAFASCGHASPVAPFFRTVPQTLFAEPLRRHRNLLRSALALSHRRRQRHDPIRGRELYLQRFQIGLDTLKSTANPLCPSASRDTISSQEILKVSGFLRLR